MEIGIDMSKWIFEKFKGDMAIYAICPICNFHYCAGDFIKKQITTLYTYCPMCGEYLYEDGSEANVTYNKNELEALYEKGLNWEIINKER